MQEQIDALGVEFAEVSFKQIGKPNCIAIGVAENQLESEQLAYILPKQRAYLIQFILVMSALVPLPYSRSMELVSTSRKFGDLRIGGNAFCHLRSICADGTAI